MPNPAQLAAMIRFHLGELSARNGHHEFEQLARHLARARLYSNILPATGPVGAGGDGGRDFETFETNIPSGLTVGTSFAARSSQTQRVVFACSLEKNIESKIRADVKTVVTSGPPDEIIYFCESNLAIGRRRKLIKESGQQAVSLRIFDGTAIAEWLAEPDIFWIAQQYLHLPADLAPDVAQEDNYAAHRMKWEQREIIPVSRSHFVAIMTGLRKATFDEAARVDLGFWLSKMESFLDPIVPRNLVRDADYEIAVAQLRGRGELDTQAARVDDYFTDIENHRAIGDISTAGILLTYCFGALYRGQYSAQETDLQTIRDRLVAMIEAELAEPVAPGRRAGLLHVCACIAQTPSSQNTPPDREGAIRLWNEMLDQAAEAPLYPIESFSDFLTRLIAYRGDEEGLIALGVRTDELLAKRLGGTAAGEKAVDRALSLIERGDRAAAIRELHRAKSKWFSGERMRGAIWILLLLSREYGELGLGYAAKYHAMAAAFVAEAQDASDYGDLLADALFDMAGADDLAGNSFAYLRSAPLLAAAHLVHADHDEGTDDIARIEVNIGQASALLGLLAHRVPAGWTQVEKITADWLPPIAEPIIAGARDKTGFWNNPSWDAIWAEMESSFADRPFGDVGRERRVGWRAHGLHWSCRFSNDYETTPAAEQLVAELQLISCALADRELGIVPAEIRVEIAVSPDSDGVEVGEIEGPRFALGVTLPAADRGPSDIVDTVEVFAAALRSASVLPNEDLRHMFDQSLLDASFIGRPYADLFRHFTSPTIFAEEVRRSIDPLDAERDFSSSRFAPVPWQEGPGPRFAAEQALEDAGNRYSQLLRSLRYTVPRLMSDDGSRALLEAMHARGMKDWEILSILGNIALNARLTGLDDDPEAWQDRALEILGVLEEEVDALAPAALDAELLAVHETIYHAAFLASWGLEPSQIPNAKALEHFLVVRYSLRSLDVDHPDIFGWNS